MDNTALINIVGFLASTISFTLWLPQAIRTWKLRNNPEGLKGISQVTQYLVLSNATLWGVYAVLSDAFWTGAPGLINAPLAIMTLIIIEKAKRNTQTEPVPVT